MIRRLQILELESHKQNSSSDKHRSAAHACVRWNRSCQSDIITWSVMFSCSCADRRLWGHDHWSQCNHAESDHIYDLASADELLAWSENTLSSQYTHTHTHTVLTQWTLLKGQWSVCLSVCLSVYLSVCLSVCLSIYLSSVIPTSFKKSVIISVPKNSKPSCLNDYRPVALTSTVMKVFERLLKKHICSSIPATLDPLQFAYRPNRSTDDAISQVLHSSLTHIDSKNGNYVRLLFIDYSSAFNTIVPTKLAVKLSDLGLNTSLCDWIQDFLTGRPQVVKMGQFTSNSITLNVGAPQGCVWVPCSTLSTHTMCVLSQLHFYC